MSTRTHTTTLRKGPGKGKQIALKLRKAAADSVVSKIENALDLGTGNHWKELTGVLGQDESSTVLWTPFGGGVTFDNPAYIPACESFLAALPDPIDESNVRDVLTRAAALFDEYIPVIDKRETPEERAATVTERQEKTAQWEAEREAARLERSALYAESPDPIETPAGLVPVVIQLHYDNSDGMSDYYNPQCNHGESYLLGYVRKGTPRTERAHREILAKYPQLASLSWTWKSGLYESRWLQSEPVTTLGENFTTYGGRTDPPAWWNIEFGTYEKNLAPFKGYTAAQSPATPAPVTTPESTDATPAGLPAGVRVEHDRDWTWIHFPGKPDESTLNKIRPHARFSRRRCAWYVTSPVTPETVGAWLA